MESLGQDKSQINLRCFSPGKANYGKKIRMNLFYKI